MAYRPATFTDACSHLVRKLIQTAYSMPANSVRPARQKYPTGRECSEFATVDIIKGPTGDFGTHSRKYEDAPGEGVTQVVETLENVYKFCATIQFFRHATPAQDGSGLATSGVGAVDKAARIGAMLSSSASMDLMARMGLGIVGWGDPVDVGAIVNDATWEDRGEVTIDFNIVNSEQFLLESFASAGITVEVQVPERDQLVTETIEVSA
jgi:hypothetical protein